MAKNPNESGSYVVVYKTNWSDGNKIELKTRLVLIRFTDSKKPWRYAVRWQTGRGDDGPTFGGSSHGSKEMAIAALMRQYYEHNALYPKGNPSHLSGWNER